MVLMFIGAFLIAFLTNSREVLASPSIFPQLCSLDGPFGLSDDGNVLASGWCVLDVKSGRELGSYPTSFTPAVSASSDVRSLAAGVSDDGMLIVWNYVSGLRVHSVSLSKYGYPRDLSFSSTGDELVVVLGDASDETLHNVLVLNTTDWESRTIPVTGLTAAAISRDGKQLFASTARGDLYLFGTSSGEQIRRFSGGRPPCGLFCGDPLVSVSHDGGSVAWRDGDQVRILNLGSMSEASIDSVDDLRSIAFTTNDSILVLAECNPKNAVSVGIPLRYTSTSIWHGYCGKA